MTGQDAVDVAEAFHETLAHRRRHPHQARRRRPRRRGAVASRRSSAGRSPSPPPARSSTTSSSSTPTAWPAASSAWATCSRLIEQAEQAFEKDQAEEAAERLLEGEFTLDDFLDQMQQLKKMGPLGEPARDDARACPRSSRAPRSTTTSSSRIEAIIRSMTPHERRKPEIINGSRRTRIANGSGTTRRRRQPAGQAVQRDAEDDEAHRHDRQAGEAGKKGKKGKRGGKPLAEAVGFLSPAAWTCPVCLACPTAPGLPGLRNR